MRVPGSWWRDRTLELVLRGYSFVPRHRRRNGTDVFEMRLLGERVVILHGPQAARIFYDTELFRREGATPARIQKTLLGTGGVHGLDGAAHRHRKHAFMQLMSQERIDELVDRVEGEWRTAQESWEGQDRTVLFDESAVVLCRAICAWAGVPLSEKEVRRRARDLTAMVDAFGAVGVRHWRGEAARRRCERWIGSLIDEVRAGRRDVSEERTLGLFARFRDVNGRELDRRVAAVEVLNILRPTLAVTYFVVYLALALRERPEWIHHVRTGGDPVAERFVHEVRRFFPFTPFLGARARSDFEWSGHRFDEGLLVVLDVFGAHHDDAVFPRSGEFDPDRFRTWDDDGFGLILQGGGDHFTGHRCAGEWITIAVLIRICRLLAEMLHSGEFKVPDQDLRRDLRRIPTRPRDGFVVVASTPPDQADAPRRTQHGAELHGCCTRRR